MNNKTASVPTRVFLGCNKDNNIPSPENTTNSRSASTPPEVAELFNEHFASVFSQRTLDDPPPLQTTSPGQALTDVILTTKEVLEALSSLDTNKASGPDGITSRLLKETAEQIAPSLTQLFNQSLSCGTVPDNWKLANVVPVYKKGNKTHVENYRPISLLSIVSKVLERCVITKIRDHLLTFVNDAQHGFRPGRSCTTQLLEVLNFIGALLDAGKQTDVVYLDMSKAFDKVDHAALVRKLPYFDISGSLLRWFQSYLQDRRQRVTVLGATSSDKFVTSGVPQGSILGPMLFLLYVNDLADTIKNSRCAAFADDTKIFRRIDSISDAVSLQDDLDGLETWSISSGLQFNQDKCKSQRITRKKTPVEFTYRINDKTLEVTTAEKDLGVWITSDLTWAKHVLDRCSNANKLLGFVRRSAMEIKNHRVRRTLFLTVVRPVLGYATQIWCPQSIDLIKRAERVQRRATKFILKLPFICTETYKDRLITTNLIPISYWHELLDLTLFFKATNGLITLHNDVLPLEVASKRLTRASSNTNIITYRPPKCRTLTFQRSFFIRTTRIWNSLPDKLRHRELTLNQFKNRLHEYYKLALLNNFNVDDPRTWKSICLKCNTSRSLARHIDCCC